MVNGVVVVVVVVGNSERCLKWDGGGWEVIKESLIKQLERWWVKAKTVHRGGDLEDVTIPAPPPPRKF